MTHRLNAQQVAHFAFRPTGGRHHVCDAVDLEIILRQLRQHTAEHVVLVECEIVSDQKLAGKWPVIAADAGNIAGIEFAENVLADEAYDRAVYIDEEAAIVRQYRRDR